MAEGVQPPREPAAPVLTDGVLVLDQFVLDDVDSQVAGEDDEHARRFGWFPERSTPATVRHAIEQWRLNWQRSGPVRALAVRRLPDRRLVGGVELRLTSANHGQISYWTFPPDRRRGVATRAVRLVCDYAFVVLGLEQLEAHIEPDNEASLRAVAAAGFSYHGDVVERTELGVERTMRRLLLSRPADSTR